MKTSFLIKASNEINTNGFAYACHLYMNIEDVLDTFPEGIMEGYSDPVKGYDGTEIGFITDLGEAFYVYSRFGFARLGCINGWYNPRISKFREFLQSRVKKA